MLILQHATAHLHADVGILYRIVQGMPLLVRLIGLLIVARLPHHLLYSFQSQTLCERYRHLVELAVLSHSECFHRMSLQQGQLYPYRFDVMQQHRQVNLTEERISLLRHPSRLLCISQTDVYLSQIGQRRIVVPLLRLIVLHQSRCLRETAVGLLIALLVIMVIAQIVVIDKLVSLFHLIHQLACFLPPYGTILIVTHKGISRTDAQKECYLHFLIQSCGVSCFQCLQVTIYTIVQLS